MIEVLLGDNHPTTPRCREMQEIRPDLEPDLKNDYATYKLVKDDRGGKERLGRPRSDVVDCWPESSLKMFKVSGSRRAGDPTQ